MASDALFHFSRLAGPGREWQPLKQRLDGEVLPALTRSGGTCWGMWHGLFGLASNELLVVTCWPRAANASALLRDALPREMAVHDSADFVATVRPDDVSPRTKPGLYVFRFFSLANVDVEEIAQLSLTAWATFEANTTYAAQPQGLFCERDRSAARGRMLLLTWYDGFASWQASRAPHPDASANFQRRAALTNGTTAYATRLT